MPRLSHWTSRIKTVSVLPPRSSSARWLAALIMLPDIIVGQSDRHHLLLVPVDHGRNAALPAQPPDNPRAGPLVLRRVARLDPYLQCFRHRSIALIDPATRRGLQNGKKGQRGATSTRTRTTLEPAIPTRDRLSLAVAKSKNAVPGTAQCDIMRFSRPSFKTSAHRFPGGHRQLKIEATFNGFSRRLPSHAARASSIAQPARLDMLQYATISSFFSRITFCLESDTTH